VHVPPLPQATPLRCGTVAQSGGSAARLVGRSRGWRPAAQAPGRTFARESAGPWAGNLLGRQGSCESDSMDFERIVAKVV
jgi:hypothetical protein